MASGGSESLPAATICSSIFVKAGLSAKDIEFLSLHYFDGRSYSQIGCYFGITKQSVKDRIHKCLRYLAKAELPMPKQMNEKQRPIRTISLDPFLLDRIFEGEVEDDEAEQVVN